MVDFLDEAISISNTFVYLTGSTGIAGFVFDISNETTVELDSIITDHYVETGTTVQDHIALPPERVTVSGFQGEYYNLVSNTKGTLQTMAEKLVTIGSYLPVLNTAAQNVYDSLSGLNREEMGVSDILSAAEDVGVNLFKAYRNVNIPQNRQQEAFIYFEALRNARQTFTIETPFRYYTDMAIEKITATQDGFSRDMSSFEITFKKIRYVNTKTTIVDQALAEVDTRIKNQKSALIEKGITKGKEVAESIVSLF